MHRDQQTALKSSELYDRGVQLTNCLLFLDHLNIHKKQHEKQCTPKPLKICPVSLLTESYSTIFVLVDHLQLEYDCIVHWPSSKMF